MNNLKRVLSLGLAGTMLAGMMMVGAGAASVTDFTDSSEIANKDAVSTMAALGVINGKDTGAFDPEGNVTRGEMAKMLCVAMNGGKDPVLGTKTEPTYTDIKGHWAESYIEYCSSVGYIAGRGDGTFAPDATVTSTEAAKIILGALGYKSDVSGLTGADWAINTNVLANSADVDLYDGLSTIDTTAPMSRDNAAQMLYNALEAKMVTYNGTAYVNATYSDKETETVVTGTKRVYEIATVSGALAGNPELVGMRFDSAADAADYAKSLVPAAVVGTDYTLTQETEDVESASSVSVNRDETFGHKYLSLTTYSSSVEGSGYITSVTKEANKDTFTVTLNNTMTFRKVDTDYSYLMGQKVKVLYKEMDNVYGIYAHTDSEVLFEGVMDDISVSGTTLKLGGTVYKTDTATISATKVYDTNDFATSRALGTLGGLDKAASVKAIDNDADGKIDLLVATPFVAAKVTYLGADTVTLNPNVAGDSSFDLNDDINVYEGIAKNDYVVAIPGTNTVDGKVVLTKAETVTGTISGLKGSGNDNAQIDGTWYPKATQTISGGDTVSLNDTAELVVVNGFYVYADINVTTSKDMAVIVGVGSPNIDKDYELSVVFTDGSTKTVRGHLEDDTAMAAGTHDGKFYTYEVSSGGVYEFTPATVSNTGYDGTVSGANFNAATDRLSDNTYIADDAVVIIRYKNSTPGNTGTTAVTSALADLTKTSVITGKSLKGLSANFGATAFTTGFTAKQNGLNYAKVLFLAADSQTMIGGTDDSYGYIVSAPYKAKEGSDTYIVFEMWNGEGVVTVKDKVSSTQTLTAPYVKGTVVSYSDEGNGIVDTVTAATVSGAVVGYSASDKVISILTSTAPGTPAYSPLVKVDSDTKYFYINSADKKGVASEGVELATELSTPGTYYQNAWVIGDGVDTVKALFMDVNNKLENTSNVALTADERVSLTGVDTALTTTNWTFTFTGEDGRALTAATEAVANGETITVTATIDAASIDKGFVVNIGGSPVYTLADATFAAGHTVTFTFEAAAGALTTVQNA